MGSERLLNFTTGYKVTRLKHSKYKSSNVAGYRDSKFIPKHLLDRADKRLSKKDYQKIIAVNI